MSKIDFGEIVQTWALSNYHQSQGQRNASLDGLGTSIYPSLAPAGGVRVDVNWEKTSLYLLNEKWEKVPLNLISTSKNLLLCGNYHNNTDAAMQQTIKLNKQTEAHCKVAVSRGQTAGLGANLRVPLPDQLTSKTLAFGRSVNVSTNDVTHQSADMTWTIDTVVTTPPRSVTNAQVIVKENSFEVAFEGVACLTGTVAANIHNKNTGAYISTVENDVIEILRWREGSSIASPKVNLNQQRVTWPVAGRCFFQFGVEHEVKLSPNASAATIDTNERSSSCAIC